MSNNIRMETDDFILAGIAFVGKEIQVYTLVGSGWKTSVIFKFNNLNISVLSGGDGILNIIRPVNFRLWSL